MDERDPHGRPFYEVDGNHIGSEPEMFHGDIFNAEVFSALLDKLGMKWCEQHHMIEEIAGGSSATRTESYSGMRTSDSQAGSVPPGI